MTAALLIGVGQYEDKSFSALPAATEDVKKLQDVLQHPHIGAVRASEVASLLDPDLQQVRSALKMLTNCSSNEVVLVYFSGYGIVDDSGQLFLASRTTRRDTLNETALSMAEVQESLENCRSQQQVLILDGCFSGAYAQGMVADSDIDKIGQQLSGKRRVLLTSPWSLDYSPQEKSDLSTYTQCLIEGLSTGMADGIGHRTLDGQISIIELHDYICDRIATKLPAAKPRLYTTGHGYEIPIAQAPYLDFRKEALSLASQGGISPVGNKILDALQIKHSVPDAIANQIKAEAVQPFEIQRDKRKQLEDLRTNIAQGGQISDNTQTELMRLQEVYDLSPDSGSRYALQPDSNAKRDTPTLAPYPMAGMAAAGVADPGQQTIAPPPETSLNNPDPPVAPTELDNRPSTRLERMNQFIQERNLPRDFSSDGWLIALAGLAVLALLGAVLFAVFQPLLPRSANNFSNAEEFFQDGYRKSQGIDRQGAIDAYTQAIDLDSNNSNFYYNRGIEHAKAGNRPQAIADYNRAISLDPAFADAYFNRANTSLASGDNSAALRDYQQAAKLYGEQKLTDEQKRAQNAATRLQGQ
ncbi:MAG: tetratricopeptide repeat protein [Myxacorys chilensis ATA2-1-KO14]|jgi:tetratricopeptide (TPR) repeat protein|nr:tetratricopeptide repeat protein [Myxacorys chilensis ATA2-1-KO14]